MNLAIYNFTDNAYKYDGNSRPNKKINKNTIFECASLSKQVFAYIALKMVVNKKLSLDKTIYKRNAVLDWFNIKRKKVCPNCRNENGVWYFVKN